MKTSRLLTLAQLVAAGACEEQCTLFTELFGKSVDITEVLCLEHAAKFTWVWAGRNLLSRTAYDAYEKVHAAALDEYEKVCAAALDEYEKVQATAWAEYEKVQATAWAEHQKAHAAAWARAYINDGE